jgi:peptide-methionine (R)-S-oxide reductase
MPSRRQVLFVAATVAGLGPVVAWLTSPARTNTNMNDSAMNDSASSPYPVSKSDDAWRAALGEEAYYILRRQGTERPFTSPLNAEKRRGLFLCAGCGQPLYSSDAKFESGTGWPSFFDALEGGVATTVDRSYLMIRTEVHCARCGGHLGHVFPDGPRPTGLRHCINGAALTFQAL